MERKLLELARSDRRFAYEAYEFACECVTYTQERLGLKDDDDDDDDDLESLFAPDPPGRHVSGEELLQGACELAVRDFGLMAPIVLSRWGIRSTEDFGEIVFRLIAAGRLARSEDDDPADYQGSFDLLQALQERYELDTSAYPPRKAER